MEDVIFGIAYFREIGNVVKRVIILPLSVEIRIAADCDRSASRRCACRVGRPLVKAVARAGEIRTGTCAVGKNAVISSGYMTIIIRRVGIVVGVVRDRISGRGRFKQRHKRNGKV